MTLRSGKGCACLLLALSVVFALVIGFLPIVVSAVPGINTLFQGLLCNAGDTFQTGPFSMRGEFACVNASGSYDVGSHILIIGTLAFGAMQAAGWILLVRSNRDILQKPHMKPKRSQAGLSPNDLHGLTSSDRLEDLKRAYDMNLISEVEYQRKRQAILDEL